MKFIGDEVLFTFVDVRSACHCAREMLALAADATIPDVRVGIAFGEVITRFGDCYGAVVNMAARLVDVAPSGAVVVTKDVFDRAGARWAFAEQRPVELKGIAEPVTYYLLEDTGG